jgi:hypothetical protein
MSQLASIFPSDKDTQIMLFQRVIDIKDLKSKSFIEDNTFSLHTLCVFPEGQNVLNMIPF